MGCCAIKIQEKELELSIDSFSKIDTSDNKQIQHSKQSKQSKQSDDAELKENRSKNYEVCIYIYYSCTY